MRLKALHAVVSVLTLVSVGCGGGNLYKNYYSAEANRSSDKKSAAADAISRGDLKAAQTNLEAVLKANPHDSQAKTMLANVYMQQTGVDTIAVANNVQQSQDAGGKVNITSVMKSLPTGSQTNITGLQNAVNMFNSIPAADQTASMKMQLATAQASLAMVTLKNVATTDSGTYDPTKAASMTATQATNVVDTMAAAGTTLANIGGSQNTDAAKSIQKTTTAINSTSGTTTADKLRSYLATQSGSGS